jgi:serine/threonine-protein kinase ATR
MNTFAIEACWRLGHWDSLEQYLNTPCESSFEITLGKLLLSMRKNDLDSFNLNLQYARESLMAPLAAASMESHRRGYEYIAKLHMLYELERSFKLRVGSTLEQYSKAMEKLSKQWDLRLQITMPSLKVREPILNIRRIVLNDLM